MDRRGFLKLCGLSAGAIVLPHSAYAAGSWHERMSPLMGTFVSVAVHSEREDVANVAIDSAFREMRRVEALITDWNNDSDTSVLNRVRSAAVSSQLMSLAAAAQSMRECSGGQFNPFTRELTLRWREARAGGRMPSASTILEAVERSRSSSLTVEKGKLALSGRGDLEFGGIGKGFVVDAGVRVLREQGIRAARIAGSGDLRFIGRGPWTVDVEDPREERVMGTISMHGEVGVATSGDYRSVAEIEGERCHHLLDSTSGRPSHFNRSVTVVAPTAALADGYSTAAFSMPTSVALAFLQSQPQVSALIIDAAGRSHRTANLNFLPAIA